MAIRRIGSPDLIHDPEELTAVWLTHALRYAGVIDEAYVSAVPMEHLGKGRTGQLVRIRPSYMQAQGAGPASVIAKFPGRAGPVRDLTIRFGLYAREVNFYQTLAAEVGIPTPRALYADANDAGETILLLEDIIAAVEGDLLHGASLDKIAVVLDHLAAMHAKWWNHPDLDAFTWLPARNNSQTIALSAALPRHAWTDFVTRNSSWISRSASALVRRLAGNRSVLDRLSTPPLTLVHGDTRINNVMFSEDGRTLRAVVDWQSVMRARPGVDVACLLVNSLAPAERRRAEVELLPVYHRALVRGGVRTYSPDDLWTDYRLEVLNELNQVVVWSSLEIGGAGGISTVGRLFAAIEELKLHDLL